MKVSEIIQESQNDIDDIVSRIEKISYNDPSGWYLQGGCYDFAQALKMAFGNGAETWTSSSSDGDMIHAYTKFNGKFYDINGEHSSPDQVIQAGDIYYDPPLRHNPNTNGDTDPEEVEQIVNQLT